MRKLKGSKCKMSQSNEHSEKNIIKRPWRNWRGSRLFGTTVLFILAVLFCIGILVAVLQSRTVPLPSLVENKINIFLNAEPNLPPVSFENAEIGFSTIFYPKLVLEGVKFSDALTGSGIRLGKLEIVFDAFSAITGVLAPKSVNLYGAVIDITRKNDGVFDLGFDVTSEFTTTLSIDDIFKKIETFFTNGEFVGLETGQINQVTVNYTDQVNQRAWTFDGGSFKAERKIDRVELRADLALLTGGDEAATLAISYKFSSMGLGELSAQMRNISAQDLALQSPALSWLEILDGKLSGSLRSTRNNGAFDKLYAILDFGEGKLLTGKRNDRIPYSQAKTYFTYSPDQNRLDINLISFESDWGTISADGYSILLNSDGKGNPSSGMILNLQVDNTDLKFRSWWDDRFDISEGVVQLKINYEPLRVDVGHIQALVNGVKISGKGLASLNQSGWSYEMQSSVPTLKVRELLNFWPAGFKEKSHKWFNENIEKGTLRNLTVFMKQNDQPKPELLSSFEFENANIKFLKHMPSISDGSGYGLIEKNKLIVVSQGGHIETAKGGRVSIKDSVFKILDTNIPNPPAKFDLQVDGSIPSVFSLLKNKPFEIEKKIDKNFADISGHLNFNAELSLILKKGIKIEELDYRVDGRLQNVQTSAIVPSRDFAARSLNILVDPNKLQIYGDGTISKIPFSGSWTQPFGKPDLPSQAVVQLEVSDSSLKNLNIPMPKNALTGKTFGDLTLDIKKGSATTFTLKSDLLGATVDIPALSWKKEPDVPAKFEISGAFSKPMSIDRFKMESKDFLAVGDMEFDNEGLKVASLDELEVGNWLSSNVDLTRQNPGEPMQIKLSGGTLDLRNLPLSKSSGTTAPLVADLDNLRISDDLALNEVSAKFLGGDSFQGKFSGKVNNGTFILGTVAGRGESLRLDLSSEDAGGVLRDAGLLRQANGGNLQLLLTPGASGWNADMQISDVRIEDAPQIAQLLSAVSVVGLLDQLDGKGIFFNSIESKFNIKDEIFTVYSSSAVGPSLGLSLDGFINSQRKVIDLQGVLSPFYLVNGIGAFLTRQGEGLIGFNFNLKGETTQPNVTVNPLSAFTPGMFREIFRRPAPEQN